MKIVWKKLGIGDVLQKGDFIANFDLNEAPLIGRAEVKVVSWMFFDKKIELNVDGYTQYSYWRPVIEGGTTEDWYMVMNVGPRGMKPTVTHLTLTQATAEAQRVADKEQSEMYVLGHAATVKPTPKPVVPVDPPPALYDCECWVYRETKSPVQHQHHNWFHEETGPHGERVVHNPRWNEKFCAYCGAGRADQWINCAKHKYTVPALSPLNCWLWLTDEGVRFLAVAGRQVKVKWNTKGFFYLYSNGSVAQVYSDLHFTHWRLDNSREG